MSKEKFLTVSVVFLLMLNAGIVAFLFINRPPRPPELFKLVVQEVKFDQLQQEKYFTLRDEHHQGMVQLDAEFELILNQYLTQLKLPADVALEDSLSNKLAAIEKRKAEHTLQHFRKVKALCQPEQAERFNALVPELMQILLPPKDHRGRRTDRK